MAAGLSAICLFIIQGMIKTVFAAVGIDSEAYAGEKIPDGYSIA